MPDLYFLQKKFCPNCGFSTDEDLWFHSCKNLNGAWVELLDLSEQFDMAVEDSHEEISIQLEFTETQVDELRTENRKLLEKIRNIKKVMQGFSLVEDSEADELRHRLVKIQGILRGE